MQYSTYRTTVRRSPSLPSPNRLRGNLIDMWSRTSAPTASVDWYGFPWLCSAEDELRAVERLERLLHERKSSVRKSPAQEPIGLSLLGGNLDNININIDRMPDFIPQDAPPQELQDAQAFQGVHGMVDDDEEDVHLQTPETPETPSTPRTPE